MFLLVLTICSYTWPWEPKRRLFLPQKYLTADRKILGNWLSVVLTILIEVTPKNTSIQKVLMELHQLLWINWAWKACLVAGASMMLLHHWRLCRLISPSRGPVLSPPYPTHAIAKMGQNLLFTVVRFSQEPRYRFR